MQGKTARTKFAGKTYSRLLIGSVMTCNSISHLRILHDFFKKASGAKEAQIATLRFCNFGIELRDQEETETIILLNPSRSADALHKRLVQALSTAPAVGAVQDVR
jgi:hypothetical protein